VRDGLAFGENPFALIPEARQVYLSDSYLETFALLHEGILEGKRLLLLIGESGMGKTILLRELKHRLDTAARTIFLSVLGSEPHEQIRRLLGALEVEVVAQDLASMRRRLSEIVESESDDHRRSVVIIDDAHSLPDASIEAVRWLSNSETAAAKRTQIILAGQPQLLEKIRRQDKELPLSPIGAIAALRPLSRTEVHEYMDCRLSSQEIASEEIFGRDALAIILKRSKGIPARVDAISLNALNEARRLGVGKVDLDCAVRAITMVESPRRERALREDSGWPFLSISALIAVTIITIFSYRRLISMPTASVQHDHGLSLNVSSAMPQLPMMSVDTKQSKKDSLDQNVGERAANKMAGMALEVDEHNGIAMRTRDSQPPSPNSSREGVVREIHRASVFMAQGRYREAIRAFEIAGILGADSRTIARRIAEAHSAEATEKQVLQ
jgi:type II secretory pathway predicted ATPase ExeA